MAHIVYIVALRKATGNSLDFQYNEVGFVDPFFDISESVISHLDGSNYSNHRKIQIIIRNTVCLMEHIGCSSLCLTYLA